MKEKEELSEETETEETEETETEEECEACEAEGLLLSDADHLDIITDSLLVVISRNYEHGFLKPLTDALCLVQSVKPLAEE